MTNAITSEKPADPSRGPWITTTRGKSHYPRCPNLDVMSVKEIGLVLSRIPRFGGHFRESVRFYSVAQHSVLVYKILCEMSGHSVPVTKDTKLAALFHDAHEAYSGYGDVISPMKTTDIRLTEEVQDVWIAKLIGINPEEFSHPSVRWADMRALSTEGRDIMERGFEANVELPKPREQIIYPQGMLNAEVDFEVTYREILLG